MSEIKLVRHHSVSIAEAKKRVDKTAHELADEYHLKSEWRGDKVHFVRSGLHGEMCVTDSEIQLYVKLGPLMRPLKARLTRRILEKFRKLFPEAKTAGGAQSSQKQTASAPQ